MYFKKKVDTYILLVCEMVYDEGSKNTLSRETTDFLKYQSVRRYGCRNSE